MNRDEVIVLIFNSDLKSVADRICKQCGDDLFSEFIEAMILKENLIDLYVTPKWRFYAIRTLKNIFLKKFTVVNHNQTDIIFQEQISESEQTESCISNAVQKLPWYERKLTESLVKAGSVSELSRKTGISKSSIHYTLKQVRTKIKNNKECQECLER